VLNFACVMRFTAPDSTGLPDVPLFNPRRAATRAEEELSPYLPPNKRAYVFGSLAAQAARFIMWLLPELKVRRACISLPCMLCRSSGMRSRSSRPLCSAICQHRRYPPQPAYINAVFARMAG